MHLYLQRKLIHSRIQHHKMCESFTFPAELQVLFVFHQHYVRCAKHCNWAEEYVWA